MLNATQIDLINVLDGQGSASSTQLAEQLKLSKRSIITYVKKINESYPGLIVSSNKGYRLDPAQLRRMREQEDPSPAGDVSDRTARLIQHLLSGYRDTINIYQACNDLHYSESTIRADLYKIQETCRELGLELRLSGNTATLSGSEPTKRRLYFQIFRPALEANVYDFSQLFLCFPQYNVTKLYAFLLSCFKERDFQVSDFDLINLLYQLVINMDRVARGHIVGDELMTRNVRDENMVLAHLIADEILLQEHIALPEREIVNIAVLLSAHNTSPDVTTRLTPETFQDHLWPQLYAFIVRLAEDIERFYAVDIRANWQSYVSLTLCIRTMLRHGRSNTDMICPYTNLQELNAAAYDCAVFTATAVEREFGFPLNKSCVPYLTLCLSQIFADVRSESATVKVLFVLPSFYDVSQALFDYYTSRMDQFVSTELVSGLQERRDLSDVDLVVSTLQLQPIEGVRTLTIAPIQNKNDMRRVYLVVEKLGNEKRRARFSALLQNITDERWFHVDSAACTDLESTVDFLVEPLKAEGIVDENLASALLEREHLATTVVGPVAILHAWDAPAARDTLSVLMSEAPLPFNGSRVRCVLLATCEEGHYAQVVVPLLQILPTHLETSRSTRELLRCRTLEEFVALFG